LNVSWNLHTVIIVKFPIRVNTSAFAGDRRHE
jgi:hypothetical protein